MYGAKNEMKSDEFFQKFNGTALNASEMFDGGSRSHVPDIKEIVLQLNSTKIDAADCARVFFPAENCLVGCVVVKSAGSTVASLRTALIRPFGADDADPSLSSGTTFGRTAVVLCGQTKEQLVVWGLSSFVVTAFGLTLKRGTYITRMTRWQKDR
jgi:hypothetical protein